MSVLKIHKWTDPDWKAKLVEVSLRPSHTNFWLSKT